MEKQEEHMKVKEVAAKLDVHRRTVERMMSDGILRRIKLPRGGVRIRKSEVLALLQPNR